MRGACLREGGRAIEAFLLGGPQPPSGGIGPRPSKEGIEVEGKQSG